MATCDECGKRETRGVNRWCDQCAPDRFYASERINPRREWERRLASIERTNAHEAQRDEAASQRFTRDDAGMAYGTDGALERAALALLNEAGIGWNGLLARTDEERALAGWDVEPGSIECIDGIEALTGDYTYADGTLTPITYATDNLPALMRERPDGVNPSDHNKFLWRNVDGVMRSDTLGIVNPRRATLGGRNRRDGRDLVRTALAVGCDGAVLRVLDDASNTDAAYAYALDTARAMRAARLAYEREGARAARQSGTPRAQRVAAMRKATIDAHTLAPDVMAALDRSRIGTSER